MTPLWTSSCNCAICADGRRSINVGKFGTVAAGNVFALTGWASACKLYCDGVLVESMHNWGASDGIQRDFPSQCIGAISIELHGGGHCGGCKIGGAGLLIKPWPKQPSILEVDAVVPKMLQFSANTGRDKRITCFILVSFTIFQRCFVFSTTVEASGALTVAVPLWMDASYRLASRQTPSTWWPFRTSTDNSKGKAFPKSGVAKRQL